MRRLQLLVVATLALTAAVLLPQTSAAANRAGALTLSPFAGAYLFEGNQDIENSGLDDSPIYGLAVGYNLTERWGLEAVAAYVDAEGESGSVNRVDVYQGRLDLLYHFRPRTAFVPYVVGGLGTIRYNPGGEADEEDNALGALGVGFKYFLNENVALRLDVKGLFDFDSDDDDRNHDLYKHLATTGGLTFQFGGEGKVAPVELPVPDSDGDGVNDNRDRCPDTPRGVPVDADGCPLDSDGDGVPDHLDRCPETPAGAVVDADGCVPAAPADEDGDGVPDMDDKCPNTPAGMSVNSYGCPSDTDKDGVFDYEDDCPDTTPGTPVGPDGCPIPAEPVAMTLQLDFDSNSARIRPEFERKLKEAADFIRAHPEADVVVEGHTDAVGTAAYNLRLSQERADNVRDYLLANFDLAGDRLEAIGYGEERPVAENNTPEGRLMNRRVVITIERR